MRCCMNLINFDGLQDLVDHCLVKGYLKVRFPEGLPSILERFLAMMKETHGVVPDEQWKFYEIDSKGKLKEYARG